MYVLTRPQGMISVPSGGVVDKQLHVLSLVADVQSTTMAVKGELIPMPDCAIFADTQAEQRNFVLWWDSEGLRVGSKPSQTDDGYQTAESLGINRDKAESMRTYARQAQDPEMCVWAAEIKLRAASAPLTGFGK